MEYTFSNKLSALAPSAIREILKATSDPHIIPFAAGNPSTEAFPVDEVKKITSEIFAEQPILALQYGVTEGYPPLVERMNKFVRERYGIDTENNKLIITSGAQQVVDLATKALCNEGDVVICESPSFIGSLNCFRSYGCRLCGIPVEADGMNIDALEAALKTEKNVRMIYTIPNFQNPSGATMSLAKRKRLYELAKQYNVIILEDNPYGDLRVRGESLPSIKTFDTDGLVIYAGSFSKILSPGLRVGYSVAPAAITAKMVVGKQGVDVHTTMLSQMIVNTWMEQYDVAVHIEGLRTLYRRKLNLMCDLLTELLADFITYNRPEGGLFVWCKLPENVDMLDFCKRGIQHGVAVVPGTAFLTEPNAQSDYIRLNFSTPSDKQIRDGIAILADVAKNYR